MAGKLECEFTRSFVQYGKGVMLSSAAKRGARPGLTLQIYN